MYECVSTVVQGLPYTKKSDGSLAKNTGDIVRLCSTKLRELVQDQDQNLKYLGLVGFSHLMLFDRRAVTEQRGLVLQVGLLLKLTFMFLCDYVSFWAWSRHSRPIVAS